MSGRSYGIEATGRVKLPYGFELFASHAYSDSTYRDNVYDAKGVLVANTADKTVVDAPKHIASGEITYENDQSVPGRVLFDATVGVHLDIDGRKFELQGNATNLFDKKYIATIGSNGFGNRGDNQTLLVGAPQQFFVTLKTKFREPGFG